MADRVNAPLDFLSIPVPPAQRLQTRNGLLVEAFSDGFRRQAADDRIRRHILRHDRTAADNRAVSDSDTGENDSFIADPDIVSDHDVTPAVPCFSDGRRIRRQIPFLEKQWERVGRKTVHRMIGGIENEFRAARDRAESADPQSVMIALRIVIQHIIPFEIARIVHEIIVNRIIPDLDERIFHHILQIDDPVRHRRPSQRR